MEEIEFSDFQKADIRTGTILEAMLNSQARKPAFVMKIDFGSLGVKTSSAQITQNYTPKDLVRRQIVAVVNFPTKRIAGVKSEVLVLGVMTKQEGVALLSADQPVANGTSVG
jgi:tRNA-binding protein